MESLFDRSSICEIQSRRESLVATSSLLLRPYSRVTVCLCLHVVAVVVGSLGSIVFRDTRSSVMDPRCVVLDPRNSVLRDV